MTLTIMKIGLMIPLTLENVNFLHNQWPQRSQSMSKFTFAKINEKHKCTVDIRQPQAKLKLIFLQFVSGFVCTPANQIQIQINNNNKYKQYLSSIDGGPFCVPAHPPTPLGGVPVQVLRGSRVRLPTLQIQVSLSWIQTQIQTQHFLSFKPNPDYDQFWQSQAFNDSDSLACTAVTH